MTPAEQARLLRWYPLSWRQRYGDELLALIEESLDGRPAPPRLRLSLLVAGLREHLHEEALVGDRQPAPRRGRAGALVVLVAWSLLVAAGAVFAKSSEHWQDHVPVGRRGLPEMADTAVHVLAGAGTVIVAGAVLAGLPALRRLLAAGGWPALRRRVLNAVGLLAVLVRATVALAGWAHRLDAHQRNGGLPGYSAAFVAWALFGVLTLAAWTAAGVAVGRRLPVSALWVRLEAVTATVLAAVIAAVTAGIVTWWVALAVRSPRALSGSPATANPSPWAWQLGLAGLLAVAATVLAGIGAIRVVGALRDGLRSPAAGRRA